MGILKSILKKKIDDKETKSSNTLIEDIHTSSDWVVKALKSSGYNADYSLESMKEIDRFFDEQSSENGIITKNKHKGFILFALGSYIGETVIKLYGGKWVTDDNDPKGDINIAVEIYDGRIIIWPVIRCAKRYQMGDEESIYAYVYSLNKHNEYRTH